MTLDHHDHRMIRLAKERRQVAVTRGERTTIVTLIAWRPQRHGKHTNKARVLFPSGRPASVPVTEVSLLEEKQNA